ncbi:MAG: PAS domain S-box protein [Chloroflexi bacterium]|nr:PAS domain S-box protein [Chloroflexota bacterium]
MNMLGFLPPQLRVALTYAGASALWILFSDSLLYSLFGPAVDRIPAISVIKGLGFVAVSALLLYLHLRGEFAYRRRQEADLQAEVARTRAAQMEMEASEQRFRKAIENAPLPAMIYAEDGEVLCISRAWLDITGYCANQLRTLDDWTTLAYRKGGGEVRATIDRLIATDHAGHVGEYTITCAGGEQRIWDFSTTPLGKIDNRRVVISISADVTERNKIRDELHHSRQFLEMIIQSSPLAVVAVNMDGLVQVWNPAAEQILGWTQEQSMGRPLFLDTSVDQAMVRRLYAQLMEGGVISAHDTRMPRRDGTLVDVSISGGPLYDAQGKLVGIAGMAKDITERKRAEAALRDSEERFRLLVQNAPEAIFVQTGGCFAFLNPAALHLFGADSPEQLLGQTALDRLHPRFHTLVQEQIQRLNDLRQPVPAVEQIFLRLDGTPLDVEVSAVPFTYGGQNGALVFFHDISIRKQAVAALRDSEERFRQMAENIREVFYLNDAQKQQTLYVSPAYEHIWGRSRESLYQHPRSFVEAIHPDDRARVVASFEVQRQGVPIDTTYRVIHTDGTMRWVRSRAFPVFVDGVLSRIAGIAEDVTNLWEYERQLKRLTRQLVDIQEAERGEIARELHDEIGQTLTGMSLSLEMLFRSQPPERTREAAEVQDIVHGLMKRVREMSLDLRPAMLDDLGLMPALRWLFKRYSERTGVRVDFHHNAVDRRFDHGLETTVYRIVQEALTNVARHAGVDEVMVDLWATDRKIVAQVEDQGRGFDVEKQRAAAATAGLLGMRERVRGFGGQMILDSASGKGTQLMVEFPLDGLFAELSDPFVMDEPSRPTSTLHDGDVPS